MMEDTMALFDETDPVVMKPGQVLFRKGEAGRHMYIVKSGEVQIVDSNHVLETVRPRGNPGRDGIGRWRPAQRHRAVLRSQHRYSDRRASVPVSRSAYPVLCNPHDAGYERAAAIHE